MHPEVRQQGPGSCPLCGMALEPAGITLEDLQAGEERDPELAGMTLRLVIGAVLTAPLFLLAMSETGAWIQLLLATPVVL